MKYGALIAVVITQAWAQAPNAPALGSISGIVKDAGTDAPLVDIDVFVRVAGKMIQNTTDSSGRYLLRGVEPGTYSLVAQARAPGGRGRPPSASRMVQISTGQDLVKIDLVIQNFGEISGIVTDDNDEPVPGLSVYLVARHYALGAIRYVYAGAAQTDDQGAYALQGVAPGRGFLVLAAKRNLRLEPLSEAPADPQLRRRAVVPTYYSGSPRPEGAQAIVLRSGERKEGVNLRVLRSPSFCIEGRLDGGAQARFEISEAQPHSGSIGDSAMFVSMPGGQPAADGGIRVCDLAPGDHSLTAMVYSPDLRTAVAYGKLPITITKEDITRVGVVTLPRAPLTGQVVWDGAPPEQPVTAQISVVLEPFLRGRYSGEALQTRTSIPSELSFGELIVSDYTVTVSGLPRGVYLKQLLYGNRDVRFEPLRQGSAVGDNGLRVVLARDGGTVAVKVADKDGNPQGDRHVVLMPLSATSEPMLADALIVGRTDQNGAWTSTTIAPGKYYAVVNAGPVDKSPETISRLWRARSQAELVEVAPNGSASVTLVPKPD